MYVIRILAAGTVLAGAFIAGMAAEKLRPFGSDYHRKSATDLSRVIGRMDAQRCCHD